MWAKKYNKCKGCGTTEKKHYGKGFCFECFRQEFRVKINEYYRNYWKQHPDKYAKLKIQTRERHKTPEGKLKVQRAQEKFREKHPDYNKEYCRRFREIKRQKGECQYGACTIKICEGSLLYCEVHLKKVKESQQRCALKRKNGI